MVMFTEWHWPWPRVVRLRRIAELEEARKALSAQDAYVRAQQKQADIPVVTHDDLRWAHGIAWGTRMRCRIMLRSNSAKAPQT